MGKSRQDRDTDDRRLWPEHGENGGKVVGKGAAGGLGLDPPHHTKEPGKPHEVTEVTCSQWDQGAIGAAAWRTLGGVKGKLGGQGRGE